MIDAPARRLLLLLWHTTQHGAHEDVPWPGGWRSCSAFFTHAETKRNTAVGGGFTQLLMPKTANLKRGRWTKLPSPCSQRFTAHHHVVQHLFDLSRYVFGSLGQPPPAGCIIQIGPNFLMELIIIWTCWISPMRTCQKSLQKSPIFQDKAPKLQQKKRRSSHSPLEPSRPSSPAAWRPGLGAIHGVPGGCCDLQNVLISLSNRKSGGK